MITVADLLNEGALPPGTTVLGGKLALGRRVTWATALRLSGGFASLESGSLAVISLETLRLMPACPSAPQAIEQLGRADVAAIALRGQLEPYQAPLAALMAERANCVLLQLPSGREWSVSSVESAVNAYLSKRSAAPSMASIQPSSAPAR